MEILGEIKDIIFRNEINSYTVATFETDEEETTIVGYLPFINKGDNVKAVGNFVDHPEYGRQFKVETFEKTMPKTLSGLEKYIASGRIKGIGPATAKKIIKKFGKESVSVIRYEPEKLTCIKGITLTKATEMSESFNENWDAWKIVEYLQKFGLGPQSAETIFKKLGENTIEKIEDNPYILVELSRRVDFKQIDMIALKIGYDCQSTKRVKSGIKYGLSLACQNGHCCVLFENLVQFCVDLLRVPEDVVEDCIIDLKVENDVVLEEREDNTEWVYLSSFYNAEKNIAKNLTQLDRYMNVKAINDFDEKLKEVQLNTEMELSEKQLEAVEAVQNNNVCVITGGPGTGKTTIIKTIIELYKKEKRKVELCAPTGRAAKKMSEATGEEAKTLHRLLEIGASNIDDIESIDPDVLGEPLDADVVIVDEMSMVDVFLMNCLLQCIYKGTKLVLVGDINQLPSVGPGNILKDIINSEKIKVVTLNKIFRQAAKSKIILNSHKVNEGESIFQKDENEEETLDDYFYIQANNQDEALNQVISLCTGRLKKYNNYDFFSNIQVISPTKKGILGTKELNKILQKAVNPEDNEKNEKKLFDAIFREGDRVMQIKNNYDIYWEKYNPKFETGKGVFNGEYGNILKIDSNEKSIKIQFDDDKIVWYTNEELDQIEHSYAITVHKAQRK